MPAYNHTRGDGPYNPCPVCAREDVIPRVVADHFKRNAGFDIDQSLVYACYVGSKAHNTHNPDAASSIDDTDILAVVVPPRERVYGLHRWEKPYQIQIDNWDVIVHPLPKFTSLCLKGNPNVVTSLWTLNQQQLYIADCFQPFITKRDIFSSRKVASAFMGYANDQLKKMTQHQLYQGYMGERRKELVREFGYDPKNAAHLIRLLRMCGEYVRTCQIQVWRDTDGPELRDIKLGKWSLQNVQDHANELMAKLRVDLAVTALPDEPNERVAECMMLSALHSCWTG